MREATLRLVLWVIAALAGLTLVGYHATLHQLEASSVATRDAALSHFLASDDGRHWHSQQLNDKLHENNTNDDVRRYDEAAPRPIPGTARSHHLSNAIPIGRTIPRQFVTNKTYHISQRTNFTGMPSIKLPKRHYGTFNWDDHDYSHDWRTLYLYNPSVLPLHGTDVVSTSEHISSKNDTSDDPDWLSRSDLEELTGADQSVRYLVSYRAYLGCNCFGPQREKTIMQAGEQISYLALALLDGALNVVPGTDVLIDLNAGPSHLKYWRQSMEDCRLSVLRGGIYAICNEEMKRLRIQRRKDDHGTDSGRRSTFYTRNDTRLPYRYPNIYGDGLEVTLLSNRRKISGGKNFNVFRSPSNLYPDKEGETGQYDYYLQTLPSPHHYHRMKVPPSADGDAAEPPHLFDRNPTASESPLPSPSFRTPDDSHPILLCEDKDGNVVESTNCTHPVSHPFFSQLEHGSACCLPLNLDGTEVMVGISHAKLSPRNPTWQLDIHRRYTDTLHDQFVSRFVAYNTRPPFDIVARSGWFCLAFGTEDEAHNSKGGSTLAGLNTEYRLDLFNQTYNCPAIHFVSSLAEVVGDKSKAIIAYGVNDCHPRMFMTEKSEIKRLLLGMPQ